MKKVNANSSSDTVKLLQPTIFIPDAAQENQNEFFSMHNPQTFETCKVYQGLDTSSEVLEVLPPFTSFKRIERIEKRINDTIHNQGMPDQFLPEDVSWLKVTTVSGKEGFMDPTGIARWTYENSSSHVRYLIGEFVKGKNRDWILRFSKLDIPTHTITSQIETTAYSSEWTEYVNEIKNLPLKNASYALRLYAHGDYCGGGNGSVIMVDTPTGLALLPSTSVSNDDGGGISGDAVYIPAVNQNGKLKLYADADPQNKMALTISYPQNS